MPRAIQLLGGEDLASEPFLRHTGTLVCDGDRGGIGEIAQHLPANGGVGIEKPSNWIHNVHGAIVPVYLRVL